MSAFHIVSIPHCQHSTCTNAHRSSVASTIFDDASTRPEPFVQHFSICELCSACIDNTISSNDHPAHGGASWCVIWLARPILLGMMLQDFPTAKRCGNTFEAKLVRKVWKVESESEQWTHVK